MSVKSKMTAIANAIRKKTGTSAKLTLDNMAENIVTLAEPFWKDNARGTTSQTAVTDSDLSIIRPYAFYGLKGIKSMTFQNENLTTIGEGAFKSCSVENLILPAGITSLSKEMFADSAIKTFTALGVTEVGEGCFRGARLTKTPQLSDEILTIPKEFCSKGRATWGTITSFSLPRQCTRIEPAAYNGLENINFSSPNSSSGKQNFEGPNLEYLGSWNFVIGGIYAAEKSSLAKTVLNFPKLKTIKHYCFDMSANTYNSTYFKGKYYNFNFNSLETMGHMNFIEFPFQTITDTLFPKLVSMGQGNFMDNPVLTEVSLSNLTRFKSLEEEGTKTGYDEYQLDDYGIYLEYYSPFENCTSLTTIILPALLEFNIPLTGCSSLTTIDLTSVTNITSFESESLTNFIIRNEQPPVLNVGVDKYGEKKYFSDTTIFYVPNPESYENLDNWSYYYANNQIRALSKYQG